MRKILIGILVLSGTGIFNPAIINSQCFKELTISDGLASDYPACIAADQNGNIWTGFGTYGYGISIYNGTSFTTLDTSNSGLPSNYVNYIAFDSDNNTWIATDAGLSKYDGTSWTHYDTTNSGLEEIPYSLAVDDADNVWVSYGYRGKGISFYNNTTWLTYDTTDGLHSNKIDMLTVDASNHLWAGAHSFDIEGISEFNGTSWNINLTAGSDTLKEIFGMAADDQGNIFVGMYLKGLFMYNGSTWTLYDTSNSGIANHEINNIATDSYGNVCIAHYEKWTLFDKTNWRVFNFPSEYFGNVTGNPDGTVWFTSDYGIWEYNYKPCAELFVTGIDSCGPPCGGAAYIMPDTLGGYSYTYNWDNGANTASVSNLCAGEHTVTISDNDPISQDAILPFTIMEPYSYLNGQIVYDDSVGVEMMDASVKFFEATGSGQPYEPVFETSPFTGGMFNLSDLQSGDYIMKMQKDPDDLMYPFLLSTYYDESHSWNNATIVTIGCDTTINNFKLNMLKIDTSQTGNGKISGTVRYLSQSKAAGEPVPGVEIFIEQEPTDEPVANTNTDSSGYYEFNDLSDSLYSIYVDVPGLPMIKTHTVDITQTDTVFSDQNFYVDTAAGGGITTDSTTGIQMISTPDFLTVVYPNPFNDKIHVVYELEKQVQTIIEIYDIYGHKTAVISNSLRQPGKYEETVNTESYNLKNGLYILRISAGNSTYIKRIVKNE